jgi:hypothetical protein
LRAPSLGEYTNTYYLPIISYLALEISLLLQMVLQVRGD